MTRYFAKMVLMGSEWGINLISVVGSSDSFMVTISRHTNVLDTITTHTDRWSYDVTAKNLSFKDGVKFETVSRMNEIDPVHATLILSDAQWPRLCTGLKNKSSKTLLWLRKRGII